MGGLLQKISPFSTFLKPYKSYENVSPEIAYQNLADVGVYLLVCYDSVNPVNAYTVSIVISKGKGQYSPDKSVLYNKNMGANLGWYNTLQFEVQPTNNITVKTYEF